MNRPALGFLSKAACLALMISPMSAQAGQSAPSGESIMRRAASAFSTLRTFQADFRQRLEDDFVDHEEARGTLYQQGDRLFAMHFSRPDGTKIIMDGRRVWIYQPEDLPGQVQSHPMPADSTYGYNVLGWLLDRPEQKYRSIWLRQEPVNRRPTDVIRLEPISVNPPFRSAIIWVDREDLLPRKVEIDERLQRRIVTLSSVKTNRTIPSDLFQFAVPNGVRVLEQE